MKRIVVMLLILLLFPALALAGEGEGNLLLESASQGTQVILEGNKGVVVDTNTILLEKSLSHSFDTEERNNYENSPIKNWLNNGFKDALANNEWIKEGSVSLLTETDFNDYKNYLTPFAIGWLQDALNPAEEPVDNTPYVENTWNYVKAILNDEIIGLGYATNFYASPVTIELNSAGYKLKKAFGKPRVLVPEDAAVGNTGEFSELTNGDKIRFANKWWTLVDTGSRKLLGEFDNISQYVKEDEIAEDFQYLNTYQFSDEITKYDKTNEKSIAHYLENYFKKGFYNQSWIENIDIPTKEQYESWNGLSLGSEWLVFSEVLEGTKVYLVTSSGLVGVNPGESYPIRALVKLAEGLFLEDMGSGYYQVTDDDGIEE